MVDYVTKGSNPWTEHYSAVCADVPDPADPGTQINTRFIQTLTEADVVAIAGEAGSHCLAYTVRDVANSFGDDSYVQRLVLLEDATSPVSGFENLQSDFIREMRGRGMQVTTTRDFLA
jgi:nicotinamidase-related amidase